MGIYESPACNKLIFVGATEAQISESLMTTPFLCRSMDTLLKNFLDADANLVLSENQCQYCYDTKGCVSCKSNRYMAKTSSESLRKKLFRDKQIEAFHAKVWEGVSKKQYTLIDADCEAAHAGLPVTYQLINFICKDASASTKIRVVTNSSVPRSGGSFNQNCLQGLCLLNSSLDVLTGFSVHPICLPH